MGYVMKPPRPPDVRSRRPVILVGIAALLVAGALFGLVQRLVPSKSFVDRVTVINPTPYELNVEAGGAGEETGVLLGTVPREQTKSFEDVLDQGEVWTFRFSAADRPGGEITVTRDDLARGQWKLTVPGAVADRLGAAGAAPAGRG
jgi:hypothetical protein